MSSTPISHVGEVGLIERLRQVVELPSDDSLLQKNLLKGISDDTAVYLPTEGYAQLITTDAFVEGIHFDLTYTSPIHLGWKALAANLSDIASMGGFPRYAVISLALPNKITVEFVEELYKGILAACKQYTCLLVGGDTVASSANMFLSITLVGEAPKDAVVYRSGAQVGDVICVTGSLGASQAGLKVLQREKSRFTAAQQSEQFQPNLKPYTDVLEKHLMPKPRLDITPLLIKEGSLHAMIDISDGLAPEIHRICKESNTGAVIEELLIPILETAKLVAAEFSENPVDYALFGGEDYELLFTLSEEKFKHLQSLTNEITFVGHIVPKIEGILLKKKTGETVELPFGGWDHFPG